MSDKYEDVARDPLRRQEGIPCPHRAGQGGVMAGHTPGPWEINGPWTLGGDDRAIMSYAKESIRIADMSLSANPNCEADARLIAAAPDMRNSIEDALKEWDILPKSRPYKIEEITDWLTRYMAPAMERLRAALAKAQEGE